MRMQVEILLKIWLQRFYDGFLKTVVDKIMQASLFVIDVQPSILLRLH